MTGEPAAPEGMKRIALDGVVVAGEGADVFVFV